MRQKMDTAEVARVAEMEEIALMRRDGGFGVDPTDWYATITTKVDLLGDIESAVRATLARV